MRSPAVYLVKADQMDRRAANLAPGDDQDDCLVLAAFWRVMAAQAQEEQRPPQQWPRVPTRH